MGDDHLFRLAAQAARAAQVGGDQLAQAPRRPGRRSPGSPPAGCARSAPVAAPRCRRGTGRRPARRRGTLAARLPVAAPGPPGRAARERSGRRRGPAWDFLQLGNVGAVACAPVDIALGVQLFIGPHHGVARDLQGLGQLTAGGHPRAAAEAAVEDPFAQRGVELAGQALGGSRWMPAGRRAVRWPWRSRREENASVDWTCGIDQQWIF